MADSDDTKTGITRRKVVHYVAAGGALALVLPSRWTRPIVQSIIVPAHAQASPPVGTTTPSPTTTSGSTTGEPSTTGQSTTSTTETSTTELPTTQFPTTQPG